MTASLLGGVGTTDVVQSCSAEGNGSTCIVYNGIANDKGVNCDYRSGNHSWCNYSCGIGSVHNYAQACLASAGHADACNDVSVNACNSIDNCCNESGSRSTRRCCNEACSSRSCGFQCTAGCGYKPTGSRRTW